MGQMQDGTVQTDLRTLTITFLEARIAEDEARARAASPSPWQWFGDPDEDEAFLYASNEEPVLNSYGMHSKGFLDPPTRTATTSPATTRPESLPSAPRSG